MKNEENVKTDKSLIIVGVTLMIGLIIAGFAIRSGIRSLKTNTITVKGYAEKDINADFAIWGGTVSIIASDQADGYTKIKNQIERVVQYLEKNGFPRNEIAIGQLNYYENFEYMNNVSYKNGYKFNQRITLESKDIDKITNIAQKSSELLLENIDFTSEEPQYLYTKLDDLKIEMLASATNDAKVRAEQIAKTGGNAIAGINSAQQGVFQITPKHSTLVYDYGMNDISSEYKTIKAVVTITYFLK